MDQESESPEPRRALIEIDPDSWRSPYRIVGLLLVVAGAVAVLFGYIGASGTLDPSRQLPYIASGGIGGVFLLGVGAALFFSADLHQTRRELADARADIRRLCALVEAQHAGQDSDPREAAAPVSGATELSSRARLAAQS